MIGFVRDCLIRQQLTAVALQSALPLTENPALIELFKEWLDHRPIWFSVSDLLLLDWCERSPSEVEKLDYYFCHRERCSELRLPEQRFDEERLLAATCVAMLDVSAFGFNESLGQVPDVESASTCAETLGTFLVKATKCHFRPGDFKELKTEAAAYLSSEACAHLW